MIALDRVEGFEWDSGNAQKSVLKHGVDQREAEQAFFNDPLLLLEDERHSQKERRLHALGKTNSGRFLHVAFTLRGDETQIRVISARPMNRKEQSRYEQEA
jgi:uncharacterized DUF497 family protein